MGLKSEGLADQFDRVCSVFFQEWWDEREEYRLKRVLNWFMGGEKKGKSRECEHERHEKQPDGSLLCLDCGERGN